MGRELGSSKIPLLYWKLVECYRTTSRITMTVEIEIATEIDIEIVFIGSASGSGLVEAFNPQRTLSRAVPRAAVLCRGRTL